MPPASPRRPSPPVVAVFTANPSCTTALDLEGEVRAIATELDAGGLEGVLCFEHLRATTPATVQRALLLTKPTVVQFSGHGRAGRSAPARRGGRPVRDLVADRERPEEGGIMLHGDRDATVKIVSGRALGDLFAKAGATVRLVVLNACHSATQVKAIVEHVDFVVGIDGAITDEAAQVFSVALYRALALGRPIKEAFELGVNALMLEGLDDDVDLPVLRARRGADPTKATLVAAPAAADGVAWDVFIAYAQADREAVRRLALELHQRHFRVFFDEWEVAPGDETTRRLEQGVEGSTQGLLAVSPHTMAQPWVQTQYAALLDKAVTERRRLLPVLVGRGDAKLPPFLRTRQCVDLRGLTQPAFREQVGVIARALRGQPPGPPPRMAAPPRPAMAVRGQSSSGSRRSTARKPR
jgi:hypothetical protein